MEFTCILLSKNHVQFYQQIEAFYTVSKQLHLSKQIKLTYAVRVLTVIICGLVNSVIHNKKKVVLEKRILLSALSDSVRMYVIDKNSLKTIKTTVRNDNQ